MKILITGICGFVGSTLAEALKANNASIEVLGIDNLIRRGSELNVDRLTKLGVQVHHGDIRSRSDVESLPRFDWVIDAAANASVLAGADGQTSSRQLMEHNLLGTIEILERCKSLSAGMILLSTSRVYSIEHLAKLPVRIQNDAYEPWEGSEGNDPNYLLLSSNGISESFPTTAPISLYGASKLASEALALEYGSAFGFPVWINRCGVLAGAGQFGKADQGIFSYWIRHHRDRKPLSYIGFDGQGHQVRDMLHPLDLVPLIQSQMNSPSDFMKPKIINVSGGKESACSLKNLSTWCDDRFGSHRIQSNPTPRPFDLPWVVLDSSKARQYWNWTPTISRESIFEEIARN
jgi:CDP-paratose 2-epimerase